MPPQVATVVFALVICVFFALDRDTRTRTSRAMWIAVIWWALSGSRNASEWLQFGAPVDQTSDAYLEGDPIDRNLLAALIISGLIVLIARHERVSKILRVNTSILLYFGYCAVSSGWSEYPDVSIKRWIRSLGDLVVILIILTDADRLAAIKRLLSRVGFLLLPVSILLIRYYPNMGRAYSRWTGDLSWTGVANGKNGLGMICLLFGWASPERRSEI